MKRIINLITTTMVGVLILGGGVIAVPANVAAAPTSASASAACAGLNQLDDTTCGASGNNSGQAKVGSLASNIVNILSYAAGLIAIIMIIVSGIRFVTSGGDAGKVAGARTALVYALIGVAVAALAKLFVHFVLNQTNV